MVLAFKLHLLGWRARRKNNGILDTGSVRPQYYG
jgi:hypothetical protein